MKNTYFSLFLILFALVVGYQVGKEAKTKWFNQASKTDISVEKNSK